MPGGSGWDEGADSIRIGGEVVEKRWLEARLFNLDFNQEMRIFKVLDLVFKLDFSNLEDKFI